MISQERRLKQAEYKQLLNDYKVITENYKYNVEQKR